MENREHFSGNLVAQATQTIQIEAELVTKLLDLLVLAARRGAFEIEEYSQIGHVYNAVRSEIHK